VKDAVQTLVEKYGAGLAAAPKEVTHEHH
jgi:hypothetical protein